MEVKEKWVIDRGSTHPPKTRQTDDLVPLQVEPINLVGSNPTSSTTILGKALYVEMSRNTYSILVIFFSNPFILTDPGAIGHASIRGLRRTMATSSLVKDLPQSIGRTRSALFSRGRIRD